MVTSKQILKELGLKNIKTLTRWYKEYELVPPPEIKTHPSGRGKMAYWDEKYLDLFKYIKSKFDEGLTVDEVRYSLGTKNKDFWKVILDSASSSVSFMNKLLESFKNKNRLYTMAYKDTLKAIEKSDLTMKKKHKIVAFICQTKALREVFNLLTFGYNPVLFVCGDKMEICADFIVADILHEDEINDIVYTFPLKRNFVNLVKKLTKYNTDLSKHLGYRKHSVILKKPDGRVLEIPYIRSKDKSTGVHLLREFTQVLDGDKDIESKNK